MKIIATYVASMSIVALFVFGVTYGIRFFSGAATPIAVHQVKPGISCATMTTSDGAAISCWKD